MAVTTFIPELWSGALLSHLDKAHVFANLVNRDYEGEIRECGDTVHINQLGAVTVKDYTKGSDIAAPDDLTTTEQTLVIDQAKYFNFGIDDIDAAQVKAPLMDKAMQRTAYALADVVDNYLAGVMKAGAKLSVGSTSAPVAVTGANAFETLVKVKTAMDKANVPTQGRWIVVPPEMEAALLLDNRFTATGGSQAEANMTNGFIGKACGFNIYVSNNVPVAGGKYSIIASNNTATTFAEQIIKTEAYRPEKGFKDAIKGLNVYGAKVTEGNAVVVLTATFGA